MDMLSVLVRTLLVLGMFVAMVAVYKGLLSIAGKKIFITAITEEKPVFISGKKLDTKNNIDLLEFIIFICNTSDNMKNGFLEECLLMLKKMKTIGTESEADHSFMCRAKEHIKTVLKEDIKYEKACIVAATIFLIAGLVIYF